MNEEPTPTRSVVVERDLPHLPQKVWRALTEGPLIEAWLMENDFRPVVGRSFRLRADWGSVDGKVLALEPGRTLSYTWCAQGLESVVTWTLTPQGTGTHLRMEQAGFRPDQDQAYRGAQYGWPKFLANLDGIAATLD